MDVSLELLPTLLGQLGRRGAFNLSVLTQGGLQRAEAARTYSRHTLQVQAASKSLLVRATAGPGGGPLVQE